MDAAPPSSGRRTWSRYVALGDSFTEGLVDPVPGGAQGSAPGAPQRHRGWADRLAEILDADARAAGAAGVEYANLAVRGRLLRDVVGRQLPLALSSGADLVSLSGGGNDLLRPSADVDALATSIDEAVAALRARGADVLLTAGFDPRGLPVVRLTRGRVAAFNLQLWSIARRRGAVVLDLWSMRALYDPRMWAPDRIHLSTEGHRRIALLAAATLRGSTGVEQEEWALPLPPPPPRGRLAAALDDAAWAREHLLPWVRRRLEHRSSGDAVEPKRPQLRPVTEPLREPVVEPVAEQVTEPVAPAGPGPDRRGPGA